LKYPSHLPLSELTFLLCKQLEECHGREWSEEAVSNKIKLIAERKPFLDNAAVVCKDVVVKYEYGSLDRLWRWEVGILDVLPSIVIPAVRKARMAYKKLLSHYMANQKLLKSLQDAENIVRDMKSNKLEATLVKIAKDEEKVLKFEREAEKQRLVQLAQKKKEQEVEDKKMEKERKKEEAEKKKLEKEREKQEAAEAREAEKRKKQHEREREKQERLQKEEKKKAAANKQQAFLMSFLALPKDSKVKSPTRGEKTAQSIYSSADFDSKRFRSLMDSQIGTSGPLFANLSARAIGSRKRRTRKFPLSVYVTVVPYSNAFDEQPFAEQQTVHVPNKYRFLSFHEDYRPAYRGTWSKRSKIVTGKTPFGKDTTCLDYDFDSEVEWEEGDDEIGEDVDDDSKNQEEEDEDHAAKVYDYDDGFCVADDQYLDIAEDVDEETKALYRKKLQRGDSGVAANRICIVGPEMGGRPPCDDSIPALIEGFESGDALELLKSHTGKTMSQDLLWLDAFAPDNIDELEPLPEPEKPAVSASNANDEYTIEEVRMLAGFVHHNSLNSKDRLIEELRKANPNVFDSRAKAARKLVSIAAKKKHPSGTGVYWEVNRNVLSDLQLHDLLVRACIRMCFILLMIPHW
jgi:chromatin assembly factor 1 subunit A